MRLVEKRNGLKSVLRLAALGLLCGVAQAGEIIQITLSPVGDPGNAADITGYGSVSCAYNIGTYDVTTGTVCGVLELRGGIWRPLRLVYAGHGDRSPQLRHRANEHFQRVFVLCFRQPQRASIRRKLGFLARFINWLQNGQPWVRKGRPRRKTETYALNGGTSNTALMAVTRSPSATWFLPKLNEWYKASYYVGGGTNAGYWLYPTQSNDVPSNVLSSTGTNNANFMDSDPLNLLTPVVHWTPARAVRMTPTIKGAMLSSGPRPPSRADVRFAGRPSPAVRGT